MWFFSKKKKEKKEECKTDDKPEVCEEEKGKKFTRDEMLKMIDTQTDILTELEDVDKFDCKVMVVEDVTFSHYLYEDIVNELRERESIKCVRECDVISSFGGHSGYNAVNYVKNLPKGKRVELAILDITLGMAVRFDADNFIMLNGIDVAKKINEKFPDVLIIFLTSHSMNESNPTIREYMNQCQKDLGVDIMSLYVHKNSNEAAEDIERVIDYQKKVRAEKN